MDSLPQTMRSLVAPKHCKPAEYTVVDLPLPEIADPADVLIRIHAGAIMYGDCVRAAGSVLSSGFKEKYVPSA